jgi:cytochrome P450
MYYLGQHPDIQDKIVDEVRRVVGDGQPNEESISKLRYTKAVLEETLRFRPIVPALALRISCQEGIILEL